MAYRPLSIECAPPSIGDFVRRHLDMQLADVHSMLRLPLSEPDGLSGGCNFAAVSTLCALVAGASTVFYAQRGGAGQRFRGVLRDYYPWDAQPRGGVSSADATKAIYDEYRNPLAHALAVATKTEGRGAEQRVVLDPGARALGVVKQPLLEPAVAALEVPTGPPPGWLTPVVTTNVAGGLDIYPHSLYWGTRRMIEALLRDAARMQQTVEWFATIAKVGDSSTPATPAASTID